MRPETLSSSRHRYEAPPPEPPSAPSPRTDANIRCRGCNKLLGELATRPWSIRCPRCKSPNHGDW